MVQFAIRCQRAVPVDADELEQWLEQRAKHLRHTAPTCTLRVSRITQRMPSGFVDIGWLLEFELPESELPLIDEPLTDALTDMRLLGFQPTVLAPVDTCIWQAHRGVDSRRQPLSNAARPTPSKVSA